jgi:hypothetical protein
MQEDHQVVTQHTSRYVTHTHTWLMSSNLLENYCFQRMLLIVQQAWTAWAAYAAQQD